MKVYLVEWHEYDNKDSHLLSGKVGVFATETLAMLAGGRFVGHSDPEYTTYTILEMEVEGYNA